MSLGRLLFPALLGLLLWAVPLNAQDQTGTIMGRVVDAATLQPLAGANVIVEGTQRGTLSRADGGYLLSGVPVGTYRVRAALIGYAAEVQEVTIAAGATVTVQYSLQPEAVALEGIVATGYGTRRREDVTGVIAQVTPEEFNTGRIISPEELIQGKVPGVQVIDTGEPGGGVNIRIRGGTSVNASNEPLFVVDGMPLAVGGGLSAGRNPLNFLNPEDVESITVLKDASATAIYGSRGANGVVIIQTRAGLQRGPQFTYSGSVSRSQATREPDMLDAQQFRRAIEEHAPGRTQYLGGANTNWRDAVLRDATGQEHTLAVAGLGESMNYRLSLGYLGQEGVVLGSMTERLSAALNYNHRLFDDRLNVRASLRGARTDDDFTPGGGLGAATIFDPTQPVRVGGEFFEQREFTLGPTNPLAEIELGVADGTAYRTIGSIESQYRMPFLEALSATARFCYDLAQAEERRFSPRVLWGQERSPNPGYLQRLNNREVTGVFEGFLNLGTRLGGGTSDIDLTVGHSYEATQGDFNTTEARGLSTDLLGPSGIPNAEETISRIFVRESRLASFFGRINYSMLDRYLLTLSVRRDGSSRFGPDNQWGTFPAAAVAWRISNEPFMAGTPWLSDLKLRASWGINGNQAFADYMWAPSYRFGDPFSMAQFGDEFVTTIRPTAVDPNIKWEETTSYNIGFDYGFLSDRFTGSVEYYLKDTEDLIFRVPVAAGTYVSNFVTTNIGSVRNQGVEFNLNARVLDGGERGFRWDTNFNAATNRNRLVSVNPFGGGTEQILVGGIAGGVGSNIQVLQPDYPINSFFVYRHKRDAQGRPVYSANQLEMYEDLNNDGVINQNDRAAFESPEPSWIFGHTSQFGFQNFDLSLTLRAHLGNYVYNNLASSQGFYNRLNEPAGPVNLHASVLEYGFESPQYFSDVYVEDASFLRMDNVTLGYNLGRLPGLQQVRVFGTLQNVFTITSYSGVDPEVATFGLDPTVGIDNNIYPRSRTLTVGISAGF